VTVDSADGAESSFEDAARLLDHGKNREALDMLREVIENNPEHVEAINKAGVAYARLGDTESAHKCFLQAIKTDHRWVPALSNLGNIYLKWGDNQRAIALYKKALKYDPDYSVAHNNIAAAYKREGEVEKQVHHYKKSQRLRLNNMDSSARDKLGNFWDRLRGRQPEEEEESAAGEFETEQVSERDSSDPVNRRWGCMGAWTVVALILLLLWLIV